MRLSYHIESEGAGLRKLLLYTIIGASYVGHVALREDSYFDLHIGADDVFLSSSVASTDNKSRGAANSIFFSSMLEEVVRTSSVVVCGVLLSSPESHSTGVSQTTLPRGLLPTTGAACRPVGSL